MIADSVITRFEDQFPKEAAFLQAIYRGPKNYVDDDGDECYLPYSIHVKVNGPAFRWNWHTRKKVLQTKSA